MRAIPLDNSVAPALIFNPAPARLSEQRPSGAVRPSEEAAAKKPDSAEALAFLPLTELAALLRTRQISSVELTRLYLQRLRQYDPVLKCVVTLTEDGPVRSRVRAGSIFICPRGLWHQVLPRSPLSMLFATPGEGTEHSDAKEPRRAGRGRASGPGARALVAHDLRAALSGLPELAIASSTTAEEAAAAVRPIASLDLCTLGVMRYSGLTPWERHPDGDELLHPLEGEVDVTLLTDGGPTQVTVRAGSVFVCPRGLWHRQLPRPAVTMFFGTPTENEEVSWAEDPRREGQEGP